MISEYMKRGARRSKGTQYMITTQRLLREVDHEGERVAKWNEGGRDFLEKHSSRIASARGDILRKEKVYALILNILKHASRIGNWTSERKSTERIREYNGKLISNCERGTRWTSKTEGKE